MHQCHRQTNLISRRLDVARLICRNIRVIGRTQGPDDEAGNKGLIGSETELRTSPPDRPFPQPVLRLQVNDVIWSAATTCVSCTSLTPQVLLGLWLHLCYFLERGLCNEVLMRKV